MKRFWTYLWQHSMIALLATALCLSTVACTPAQVDTVLSDIDLVLQTANSLEAAIGSVSPADAAALSLLTGLAIKGIGVIQTDYNAYEASKTASNLQNVVVAAQTLQANLPTELSALHIVSSNAVTKATNWVNLVVSAAAAVVTAVTEVTGTPGVATAATARTTHGFVVSVTPESLQARWTAEVCSGDTACGALVKVNHKHAPRHLKL